MGRFLLSAVITLIYILASSVSSYGLGDGSSCSTDMPSASGIADFQKETGGSLIITAGYEDVLKKPLDNHDQAVSARIEGNWYLLGLGYRIFDRIEPYLRFGVSEMNVFWTENSQQIEMSGETHLALGAGLKIRALKLKLTKFAQLKFNLDGQIRYTEPHIDKITLDGASRSVSAEEFRILEARGAATIGFEISLKKILGFEEGLFEEEEIDFYLIPYAGVLYSDSLVRAEFEYSSRVYDLTETRDRKNLHLITGLDFVAPGYALLNVEAQLFDGESVSGGVTLKF